MTIRTIRWPHFGLAISAALAIAVAACAGGSGAGAAGPAGAKPWDKMSDGERGEYMKTVVVPEFTTTFQTFDAEHFSAVNCVTCHGPGAKTGQFEMPTAALPKLNKEEIAEHPKWTKFMKEKVTPQMGDLLVGEEVNCYTCHMKK